MAMLGGKLHPPPSPRAPWHTSLSIAVKWARHASSTPKKNQGNLPRLDLDRQVCGYATLGQICYLNPTRDDRDRYLSNLQRQIDNLAAGPPTADSEKLLEGLTELHECVGLLPTSSIGWSDESYPVIDDSSDEIGYCDKNLSDDEGYYDDWSEADSLNTADYADDTIDDKSLIDNESFIDDESSYLLSDNKRQPDGDTPTDKAPVSHNSGGLAPSTLNPAAAPWRPPRPASLNPEALPWHPAEDADRDMVSAAGIETPEGLASGPAAMVERTPPVELVEAATLAATEIAAERPPLTAAPAEATALAGLLRELYRTACRKILSARTALATMVAVMFTVVATALPAKAPAAAPAKIVSAMPDKYRLMASQTLANSRGKRKLIDRPQRWQKYLESGRIDPPQRWRSNSRSGGTDGASHTKQRARQTVLELEVPNTAVA